MIVILAFSPLEASFAAVSNCSKMVHDKSVMTLQSAVSHERVAANPMMHDSCTQHDCSSVHCYSSAFAVVFSINAVEFEYLVNTILQSQTKSLKTAYTSTIFRPPKI